MVLDQARNQEGFKGFTHINQPLAIPEKGQVYPNPADSILSVKENIRKVNKITNEAVIPTWSETKSLLLSHSSQHGQSGTNTEVIAPLFKTSLTDYRILYIVLMLTLVSLVTLVSRSLH